MEFQQIKEWANNPMVCISGLVKENIDTLIAAVESLTAEKERGKALQWIKGEPPYPYSEEWFIARTIHREKVVLRSLPKEYSYDYTTADGTYMKRENITAWMQFPDSQYKSFALTTAESSLAQAREEIEKVSLLAHDGMKKYVERAEAAEQREKGLVERLGDDIYSAIKSYRCTFAQDYEGNGIELSDVIATGFGDSDIGNALKELASLSDHIYCEVMSKAALAAASKEGENADT